MERKLAIRLRKFRRICPITGYKEESIKIGSPVIVETDRGTEYGEIIAYHRGLPKALSRDVRLKKVLRYATDADIKQASTLSEKEDEALVVINDKLKEHELPIRIISAEYLFDGSKVIFYYRIEEGVKAPNLKGLIKDLQNILKAKVEARQVSPRDCARIFGGLGPCGRPLCCATWLEAPKHISVKMVKDLGLTISPGRTSGLCGRLMCCLQYEHEGKAKEES